MIGVVLLLLTLAYGLTGYLLPWDNRAYWGTVVTTQIAAQAPVLGPYLSRLLGGDGAIGVVTFARFYGLHVLLLPPATMLLIALHVYLVRKHGVAPVPGDEAAAQEAVLSRSRFSRTRSRSSSRSRFCSRWRWSCACRWSSWPIPPIPPTSRGRNGISCSCSRR